MEQNYKEKINFNYLKNAFRIGSFLIILLLLFILYIKMSSTYESKKNFIVFNDISYSFMNNKPIEIEKISLVKKKGIGIVYSNDILKISVRNIDYRSCLKYGVDYIDSNFDSISINEQLLEKKTVITRDVVLDKCNKKLNNIILSQKRSNNESEN